MQYPNVNYKHFQSHIGIVRKHKLDMYGLRKINRINIIIINTFESLFINMD